jgi:predicted nucleic acid-binding protein
VIGGRILDTSALIGFAASSPYPQAVVWTAAEQGIVLAVPTCALAEAWSKAPRRDRDALRVLRSLPVVVTLEFDTDAAHDVGLMLSRSRQHGALSAGHVTWCAQRRRGWPVVTGEPRALLAIDSTIEIDRLP